MQIDDTSTARRGGTGGDCRRDGLTVYGRFVDRDSQMLGWRETPRADVWIAGHDLLHDRHPVLATGPAPRRIRAWIQGGDDLQVLMRCA